MTRNGFNFGSGLSTTAAANVTEYVGSTGITVLLNGDFADSLIGEPNIQQLVQNSVDFAASSGNGFIGELNGTVSALTANSSGFNPLNLVEGSAASLTGSGGGSNSSVVITSVGIGNPILNGVTLPYNPSEVEFGASITGVDSDLILATWSSTGDPSIIANVPVPEPLTILGSLTTAGFLGFLKKQKR